MTRARRILCTRPSKAFQTAWHKLNPTQLENVPNSLYLNSNKCLHEMRWRWSEGARVNGNYAVYTKLKRNFLLSWITRTLRDSCRSIVLPDMGSELYKHGKSPEFRENSENSTRCLFAKSNRRWGNSWWLAWYQPIFQFAIEWCYCPATHRGSDQKSTT